MRMTLRRRERMSDDRGHEIQNGVYRRDLSEGPLSERGIARALRERTELEQLASWDLTRGGLALALAGLRGPGCRTFGEVLRGNFYLGR